VAGTATDSDYDKSDVPAFFAPPRWNRLLEKPAKWTKAGFSAKTPFFGLNLSLRDHFFLKFGAWHHFFLPTVAFF
jgi:hypothetical protein